MSSDMTNLIQIKSSVFVTHSLAAIIANELLFEMQKCVSVISCPVSISHDKQLIINILSEKKKTKKITYTNLSEYQLHYNIFMRAVVSVICFYQYM